MQKQFSGIFAAILDDDRPSVKALLKNNPRLAGSVIEGNGWYEPRIGHQLYTGDTGLHLAAAGYRIEIASMLLVAGADAEAAGNHRGSQPLHYAADGNSESPFWDAKRQVAMINLLLKAGANIQAQDKNGATPLHRAVRTRCAAAVKCLLKAGADATVKNKPGSTPFHLAVQNTGRGGTGSTKAKIAQRAIIDAFLEQGISPTLKDGRGKSVSAWAKSDWIRQVLSGSAPS